MWRCCNHLHQDPRSHLQHGQQELWNRKPGLHESGQPRSDESSYVRQQLNQPELLLLQHREMQFIFLHFCLHRSSPRYSLHLPVSELRGAPIRPITQTIPSLLLLITNSFLPFLIPISTFAYQHQTLPSLPKPFGLI
ncbi:hypothetical protein PENTCL1PPCAC_2019 [Pristionchus entomophagus]|uniref:G protein-coupled receptor n=1 Tax=Pristionchus entomophagus TaxID=358040 RepID=A0AAV5SEL0_9BILA|nr:hypothetical protein PENTCL1PPCAC_2019 [Pristionchus entomophagus]